MCRHLAYLGPASSLADLVIRPPGGLYEQSWAPRMQRYGTVNADGFGLGWYPAPRSRDDHTGAEDEQLPARYRRAVPVWADVNLPDLTRAVHSTAVLAAVRDATEGTAQDETAPAPYADGRLLFSHNGAVRDWERLVQDLGLTMEPDELLGLEARCDSALLWALLTNRIRAGEPAEDALAWLAVRIRGIRTGARLNFLLTDGRTIWATRCGDTLWYRTGPGSVRVASEPDDAPADESEAGWQEVPEDSLLVATVSSVRTVPLVHTAQRPPAHVSGGVTGIHARRS
ncbi:ergothioneine biosynthesis protein EgtC [Streptomyces bathyalis]|uniref:Gamma-glutamyl-hercynylcysteine sulfoxide hydrolase n=1 Tax=Streptomyces bathyalis TaxID=2710756 RepID=A0A7T1WQQ7_9ACTN|nr:ergothioneine biosynthesis protein EgtC [Streptomyces bathyalis]QPP05574.1 ergothioneine biosynthesis protein EgtC [Streptomyces bathyalis]